MAPHRCAALGAAGSAGSGCGAREAKQRLRPSLQARSALRLPPSSAGCSSGSIASSSTSSTSGSCPSCSCCSSSCRRCRSPSGSTSSSTRMSSQSASHLGSCSALTRSCQGMRSNRSRRGQGALGSSAELAGQYEDSFADVEKQLFDYFTFKAVNTVLCQLLEMNPGQYTFLYNFVVNNKVQDSKLFIRSLVQERQELAERIMVTRLHLYSTWAKKYDHANMHAAIKDQNLELLRERLIQTVRFQAEDSEGTPHE